MKNLQDYIENISDDFQSTFIYVGENKLVNMLSGENDFPEVTRIIQNYMGDVLVDFHKTNQMNNDEGYDVYIIEISSATE
jgi:hypothetical protein